MSLEALLQNSAIWRGRDQARLPTREGISTGHRALDANLPGGGWPRGALSEILYREEGIGELQLLMPALVRLSREPYWQAWVGPPHPPYAPALSAAGIDLSRLLIIQPADPKEQLWALEQVLRSGSCSTALAWLPATTSERQLRRLQLAAEESRTPAFLFRPEAAAARASPAALRIKLEPVATGLKLHILKCRGSWSRQPIPIERLHAVA
jgi:cell division inhibitor SulA